MEKLNTFYKTNTYMCGYFLTVDINEKILSVDKLMKKYSVARGTIQKILESLEANKAVTLKKMGRQGTVLVDKNINKLLDGCNVKYINGVMPMPYTLKYEGLASALLMYYKGKYNLKFFMSFTRSSKDRISMVKDDVCSFAVVSNKLAKKIVEEDTDLQIAFSLGSNTYTNNHAIVSLVDYKDTGMKKVGVDYSSVDHEFLVDTYFNNGNYELVDVKYNNLLDKLLNGEIDITIINLDQNIGSEFKTTKIEDNNELGEATVICKKDNIVFKSLNPNNDDIDLILKHQNAVVNKTKLPSY